MFPREDKRDGLSAPDLIVCVVFVLVWQSLDYVIVPSFAKSSCLQSHLTLGCIASAPCGLLRSTSIAQPPPSYALHSPPLYSFPLPLPLPLSFLPYSYPLSPPLFLPTQLPFYSLMEGWIFFFPLMALSTSSAPYFVLAAPTLLRNLSAATGNSVHMHIYVLSTYGFCLFFVDIKLEMLAKVELCLPHSKFISGGKKVQWLPGHLRVTLTAHCRLEI